MVDKLSKTDQNHSEILEIVNSILRSRKNRFCLKILDAVEAFEALL